MLLTVEVCARCIHLQMPHHHCVPSPDSRRMDGMSHDRRLMQGELIETWMLLEYADRGSLEQAIGSGRFLKRVTRTLDMVGCPAALLDQLNTPRVIQQVRSGSYCFCTAVVPAHEACSDRPSHGPGSRSNRDEGSPLTGARLCVQGFVYKSLQDIATGMQYLHGLGIIHGDLKAANVLLKSTNTDARGFICKCVLPLSSSVGSVSSSWPLTRQQFARCQCQRRICSVKMDQAIL